LVNDSGSIFTIADSFLFVHGSTLASATTNPFITLSGSTVNTGDEFLLLTGSGSKITLSSSLLSAGSTLNVATDPVSFGDLVDINGGGQLVMNSSDPVVLFTAGTHTVGTDDSTGNNTPNRLFRLSGVNTDGTTGLGTDQPIKGTNPPFDGATNPIGVLLKATDGATIEVKRGAGDTFGTNALRLDTALYEATAPIINLIGSATTPTTLTTTGDPSNPIGDTINLFRSKVVSLGPVVALDKGIINVTNGALINLTSGSNMTVTGDLLSLINQSKINVVNGPLIKVSGVAPTGTSPAVSTLNVSGALVNFGGTGGNQIIVNNAIAPTATVSGLPVNTATGGTIAIGPNPVKNPGLGSITVNGGGSLIQATNNGAVNITAP
jgi:hypothetical protein